MKLRRGSRKQRMRRRLRKHKLLPSRKKQDKLGGAGRKRRAFSFVPNFGNNLNSCFNSAVRIFHLQH